MPAGINFGCLCDIGQLNWPEIYTQCLIKHHLVSNKTRYSQWRTCDLYKQIPAYIRCCNYQTLPPLPPKLTITKARNLDDSNNHRTSLTLFLTFKIALLRDIHLFCN